MASGFHFVTLCVILGLSTAVYAQDSDDCCPACPPGFTMFENRCFVFVSKALTWQDAEKECLNRGGNLASLLSTKQYGFVRQIITDATGKHTPAWVGGHDSVQEGVWLWSDGAKFEFKGWYRGEPNNAGSGEDCIMINFREIDYVNDAKCTSKMSFVCSKDL